MALQACKGLRGAAMLLLAVGAMGPALAASPFGAASPVSDAALAARRGGTAVAIVTDTSGAVQNNSAVNVVSGSNAVREGSFANAVGVSTVIQNTGSNVLIQNATTVNVQFH